MKNWLLSILIAIVLGGVVGASTIFLDGSYAKWTATQTPRTPWHARVIPNRIASHIPPSCNIGLSANGDFHTFMGNCPVALVRNLTLEDDTFKSARDERLTGSKTASAEWSSPNEAGVTCGITPTDQYLIVRNQIGTTRYDEPMHHDWDAAECSATSPLQQEKILKRAAEAAAAGFQEQMDASIWSRSATACLVWACRSSIRPAISRRFSIRPVMTWGRALVSSLMP